MTVKPKRAAIPDDLRDIFKRVRILEAVPRSVSSAGVFTTYQECIVADPTTLNLWPCDDVSGGLVDIVGSGDMTEIPWDVWPKYGRTGPFTGLPLQTAVENGGFAGPGTGQARFASPVGLPALTTPFTLQGWLMQVHVTNGGQVWNDDGGGAGNGKALDIQTTTFAITYGHGNGLSVTGGALVPGTWTHVRIDYDGTTLRLFQDGVLLATDTGSGSAAQGAPYFLNNNNFGGTGFAPFHGRAALWSLHDGIASICDTSGSGGSSNAPEFYVPVADGSGGVTWDPQTIEVDYSLIDRFSRLTLGSGLTGTDLGGGELSISASGAAGAAGGVLSGTYPNPGFAVDMATQAELDAHITDPSGAHAASAVSITDAGGYFDGTEVETALQDLGAGGTGVWELVMEDGVTAPPVPVETTAQDDWIYAWVAG